MPADSHIPIIGQTRHWKAVQFTFAGIGRPPAVLAPGEQPEVVGFQIGFVGTRSDDTPIQCYSVIELAGLAKVDNPIVAVFKVVEATMKNFETFRTCNCLPAAPCNLHRQVVPGKAS